MTRAYFPSLWEQAARRRRDALSMARPNNSRTTSLSAVARGGSHTSSAANKVPITPRPLTTAEVRVYSSVRPLSGSARPVPAHVTDYVPDWLKGTRAAVGFYVHDQATRCHRSIRSLSQELGLSTQALQNNRRYYLSAIGVPTYTGGRDIEVSAELAVGRLRLPSTHVPGLIAALTSILA